MKSIVTALDELGISISLDVIEMVEKRLGRVTYLDLSSRARIEMALEAVLKAFNEMELFEIYHRINTFTRLQRYSEYSWQPGEVNGEANLDNEEAIMDSFMKHLGGGLVVIYHRFAMTIIGVAEPQQANGYKQPIFFLLSRDVNICFRSTATCSPQVHTALLNALSVQSIDFFPLEVHDINVVIRWYNNHIAKNWTANVALDPQLDNVNNIVDIFANLRLTDD